MNKLFIDVGLKIKGKLIDVLFDNLFSPFFESSNAFQNIKLAFEDLALV